MQKNGSANGGRWFAVREVPEACADAVVKMTGRPVAVVDCFGILDDASIRRYFELGCEVKGLGRGHVKRIKDEVRKEMTVSARYRVHGKEIKPRLAPWTLFPAFIPCTVRFVP